MSNISYDSIYFTPPETLIEWAMEWALEFERQVVRHDEVTHGRWFGSWPDRVDRLYAIGWLTEVEPGYWKLSDSAVDFLKDYEHE